MGFAICATTPFSLLSDTIGRKTFSLRPNSQPTDVPSSSIMDCRASRVSFGSNRPVATQKATHCSGFFAIWEARGLHFSCSRWCPGGRAMVCTNGSPVADTGCLESENRALCPRLNCAHASWRMRRRNMPSRSTEDTHQGHIPRDTL